MALPRLDGRDDVLGFRWLAPDGTPMPLGEIIALPGAEPHRWLPTHLEAVDDLLIDVARRFGEVLGGGRAPAAAESEDLALAYAEIDVHTLEYADAHAAAALPDDIRAGQILGTGALMSIRARAALGLVAPAPFDGDLDHPGTGVVGGRAGLHWVEPGEPWRGARWLVVTEDGRRLPATLSMLLFDSSGVDKQAALTEHRDALRHLVAAAAGDGVEPMQASGALDWLLFDWVMAHRESADSGAVEIRSGRAEDARLIVAAAAQSVRQRARFDPNLVGRVP